MKLKFHANIAL